MAVNVARLIQNFWNSPETLPVLVPRGVAISDVRSTVSALNLQDNIKLHREGEQIWLLKK